MQAQADTVNSDMALYDLNALVDLDQRPDDLIDHKVRIDCAKLRHLVQIDRRLADREAVPASAAGTERAARLNGNFSRLRGIIETGEEVADIQLPDRGAGAAGQLHLLAL